MESDIASLYSNEDILYAVDSDSNISVFTEFPKLKIQRSFISPYKM